MSKAGIVYHTKASKFRPLYSTGRPAGSEEMALSNVPRMERACLKCEKKFIAVGVFNRICFYCNVVNASIAGRGE